MPQRTALYEQHLAAGARMVDFGGWDMPLHYGSQIEEHLAVRAAAGVFDVSHMCVVDVAGAGAEGFLRHLLANDVARLAPGKALYSCMLQPDGGVVDDLIAYRLAGGAPGAADAEFRLVVNAATAPTDLAWMERVRAGRGDAVQLRQRPDCCLLAVQGPRALALLAATRPALAPLLPSLPVFAAASHGAWFVARTGYTGEDGVEIALPVADALALWRDLLAQGVRPCGLGARDTLRLEAGMNLYGSDMDATVTPLESGLAWTVDLRDGGRDFLGRAALEAQQARGGLRQLLGLRLLDKGVLRSHQDVTTAQGAGTITSGTYAPTVAGSIALARLPAGVAAGDEVQVALRAGPARARVCRPPFVRHGKVLVA